MGRTVIALTACLWVISCSACSSAPSRSSAPTRNTVEPATTGAAPQAGVVDGVPLVPITASQHAECTRFANHLHRSVPCPGLLPDPIPTVSDPTTASCLGVLGEGSCGPAVFQVNDSFLVSQSNFQVPPNYIGVTFEQYSGAIVPETSLTGGPLGHFVFTADPGVTQVPSYCSPLHVGPGITVHGVAASVFQCSSTSSRPGELKLLMGHELLVWSQSGMACAVSFHGLSQVNFDLDIAVADASQQVSPTTH